ncbi:MAG: Rpp14/Pop5 family protein [Nanoarchaeota archaeon]|nr:Rpp14/Pop5 family protein [Nanoarchaeota archaeon]
MTMRKKAKLKVLTPVLREKKRYLVYSVDYFGNKSAGYELTKKYVNKAIFGFIGDLGYGKAGVMFIKGDGKKGIMKVQRGYVDHIRTSLMAVREIENKDVAIRCLGLSGSVKKAEEIYNNIGGR